MKQDIKMLAMDLDVGEQSDLMICPACEGGMTKEKSFSAKRESEGVVYHCFRASCGIRGLIPTGARGHIPQKHPPKKCNPFHRDVVQPHWLPAFLSGKFPAMTKDIVQEENVMYSEQVQRVLYPCYNSMGYRYAWNARAYKEITPYYNVKSILYFDNKDQEKLHFPVNFRANTTVTVVEDQVSAMIGSRFAPCVALMGTDLAESSVKLMCSMGIRHLRIALDPDAMRKAISIYNKYKLDFNSINILSTTRDIKDLDTQTLQEVLT